MKKEELVWLFFWWVATEFESLTLYIDTKWVDLCFHEKLFSFLCGG